MLRKISHEEQLLKKLAELHKRIALSPHYPPPNNGKRLTSKIIDELKTAQQYLDFVGVIIVILGADQRLIFMNKKGYDIFKNNPAELKNFKIAAEIRKNLKGLK